MKLTVSPPVVLPDVSPIFIKAVSISFGDRSHSERRFHFFQTVQSVRDGAPRQRPVYKFDRTHQFNDTVTRVHTLRFDRLNSYANTNVPEFADSSESASLITGRRIFFRTQPSKTSVELLSLTTGLCSVRVKNKATGEATLLLCIKT